MVLCVSLSASSVLDSPEGNYLRKVALKIMLKVKHQGTQQEDITAEIKFREDMKGHSNILVFDHYWYVKLS